MVFVATSAFSKTTREEMACDKSPIQLGAAYGLVTANECVKLHFERRSITGYQLSSDTFYRYGVFENASIHVRLRRAYRRTIFTDVPADEVLKRNFRRLAEDSVGWSRQGRMKINGRRFDIYRFEMPGLRHCVGFVHRWLHISGDSIDGWARVLTGYVCQQRSAPDDSRVRQLLADLNVSN